VIDATVATFEAMYTARPGSMDAGAQRIAARMPAQVRRGFLLGGLAQSDFRADAPIARHTPRCSPL